MMNRQQTHPSSTSPAADPEMIKSFLRQEVSWRARRPYFWLLLIALSGAIVPASLAWTEPALPALTRAAFIVLTLIALSWAGFAAWVLSRQKVLFAFQRVLAGRLAVAYSSLFTLAAAAIAMLGRPQAWAAVICGLIMVAVAGFMLHHGRQQHRALLLLRDSLQEQVSASGAG